LALATKHIACSHPSIRSPSMSVYLSPTPENNRCSGSSGGSRFVSGVCGPWRTHLEIQPGRGETVRATVLSSGLSHAY